MYSIKSIMKRSKKACIEGGGVNVQETTVNTNEDIHPEIELSKQKECPHIVKEHASKAENTFFVLSKYCSST